MTVTKRLPARTMPIFLMEDETARVSGGGKTIVAIDDTKPAGSDPELYLNFILYLIETGRQENARTAFRMLQEDLSEVRKQVVRAVFLARFGTEIEQ